MQYNAIYWKSRDEQTLVAFHCIVPAALPDFLFDEGYQMIKYPEFMRLKRRLAKTPMTPPHSASAPSNSRLELTSDGRAK